MTGETAGSGPAALVALAGRLARESGHLLVEASRHRQARLTLGDTARRKSSTTDLATEADRASERLIVGGIKLARPDDAVLGEEGSDHAGSSGLTWFVDPIDGTTNFVYGFGSWTVSIGVADGAGMLAGAVYDPLRDEMFTAGAGLRRRPRRAPARAARRTAARRVAHRDRLQLLGGEPPRPGAAPPDRPAPGARHPAGRRSFARPLLRRSRPAERLLRGGAPSLGPRRRAARRDRGGGSILRRRRPRPQPVDPRRRPTGAARRVARAPGGGGGASLTTMPVPRRSGPRTRREGGGRDAVADRRRDRRP